MLQDVRTPFTIACGILLSGCLSGCIGFPLGKEYQHEMSDGRRVDLSPERLCGNLIHSGMTRDTVKKVAADLELDHREIDPFHIVIPVWGSNRSWYLMSPEGGGLRITQAKYEMFVVFNAQGRVEGCHTEESSD